MERCSKSAEESEKEDDMSNKELRANALPAIGLKFAIQEPRDDFGEKRPPKWAEIISVQGDVWTLSVKTSKLMRGESLEAEADDDDDKSGSHSTIKDNGEIRKLNKEDLLDLMRKVFVGQPLPSLYSRRGSRKQGVDIDRVAVPAYRRQFVGFEFASSHCVVGNTIGSTKNEMYFGIVSDCRLCPDPEHRDREREVWMVLYDDNRREYWFKEGLQNLLAARKKYDPSLHKISIRNICRSFAQHWLFDATILCMIFANCVVMILEAELDACNESDDIVADCDEPSEATFYVFDTFFTCLFFVEMVVKMLGFGLLVAPDGYFRDVWNWLDFLIVVEGTLSIFLSSDSNLSGIRALRILRPLRAVTHVPELKQIVDAFIRSMPLLGDTMIICAFYFVVFGICGVQIWIGMYRSRCFANDSGKLVTDGDDAGYACGGSFTCDAERFCGYNIENPNGGVTSFDNIFVAFLTIFQAITLEGWVDIMYWGMDSVSPWTWIYFILMIMFGAFILINLTLAVILSKYEESKCETEKKEKMLRKALAAPRDGDSAAKHLFCFDVVETSHTRCDSSSSLSITVKEEDKARHLASPAAVLPTPSNNIDDASKVTPHTSQMYTVGPYIPSENIPNAVSVFGNAIAPSAIFRARNICVGHFCRKPAFDISMCLLILGNMIVLSLDHYPQSQTYEDRLNVANNVFTILFVVEMAAKWIGFGLWGYFVDAMNQVDFCIIFAGVIDMSLGGASSFTALRAVRFVRLVKLVRFMESMQHILRVLAKSLTSALYVGMLMLLFMMIYSILGMQFFMYKLKDDSGVTSRNNYDTFHWAFVSVFQVMAGENWPALMYEGIAGTDWATGSLFYISWVVIGQFVLLNLLLAVIMSNFENIADRKKSKKEHSDGAAASSESKSDGPSRDDEDVDAANKVATKLNGVALDSVDKYPPSTATKDAEENDDDGDTNFDINSLTDRSSPRSVRRVHKKLSRDFETLKKDQSKPKISVHLRGNHTTNLFCVQKGSPLHRRVLAIVSDPRFDNAIIFVILLSSLSLAFECPATVDPDHEESSYSDSEDDRWEIAFFTLELIFTTIFTFEVIMKTTAMGFVLHKNAYLRDPWNIVDFVVVLGSIADLSVKDADSVSIVRVLRLIRILRPLRVIKRNEGLKLVLNSLLLSFDALKDILLVLIFVWIVFCLLGVQLFKGRLYQCNDVDFPPGTSKYGACATDANGDCLYQSGNIVYETPPCLESVTTYYQYDSSGSPYVLTNNTNAGGVQRSWQNSDMNFDNVYEAFLVLYVSASGEGWPDVMFQTCDITGIDSQPETNNSEYYAYYWVIYVTVVCFFFAELFVGAVFEKFMDLKREGEAKFGKGASIFLTEWQRHWVQQQKVMMNEKPLKPLYFKPFFPNYSMQIKSGEAASNTASARAVEMLNLLRKHCHAIAIAEWFDELILFIIVLNTLTLAMPFYEMGEHMVRFLDISNLIFTIIFVAEMLLKWFGLSLKTYFQDDWNRFDCAIVFATCLDFFVSWFPVSIFRILRVGRALGKFLKMLRQNRANRCTSFMEGMQQIITTLWLSIPALVNIGAVMLLLFFIYAVLGVFMFGDLDLEAPHSSFRDFPNAMLTLFRVSTGEDWQNLMYASYDGDFGKYGSSVYFVTFVFVAAFIILNLFVMIISDNFEKGDDGDDGEKSESGDDSETHEVVTKSKLFAREFRESWARFDPTALQFIPKEKLREFLIDLGQPFGLSADSTIHDYEHIGVNLHLLKMGDHIHFTDLIVALHELNFKSVAMSIPDTLHEELGLQRKELHKKVVETTVKRERRASRTDKKMQLAKIVKMISTEHDEDKKEDVEIASPGQRPKHWEEYKDSLSFEFMVKRVQRRWRNRGAKNEKKDCGGDLELMALSSKTP
eukprot:g2275.t1